MIQDGGEIAFVGAILEWSTKHQTQIKYFTSMIGRLSSLASIVSHLRRLRVRIVLRNFLIGQIENYAISELVQGSRTKRWVVGWSFGPQRFYQELARPSTPSLQKLLPETTLICFTTQVSLPHVAKLITEQLLKLKISSHWMEPDLLFCSGNGAVWSRAARRKVLQNSDLDSLDAYYSLSVSLRCFKSDVTSVDIRWLIGNHHKTFESFAGMLRSTLQDIVLKELSKG